MEQYLTFDKLPEAVTELSKEVSELKRLLIENREQPTTTRSEHLLTIDEIAELLHLAKPTIYSKVSKNEMPGVCKQGKRLYFDRQIIIDWIKQGRKISNAETEQSIKEYLLNQEKGLNHEK